MKRSISLLVVLFLIAPPSNGGWRDWLEKLEPAVEKGVESVGGKGGVAGVSAEQAAAGLKEALRVGSRQAVALLGREGGFLDDGAVRIPMPERLRAVERGLRAMKQDRLADQFVTTLNRAAEQAVPAGLEVVVEAIDTMTLEDALAILNGPDDAATQYFRRHGEARLREALRPIVRRATDEARVTGAYKALMAQAGGFGSMLGEDVVDLDGYVTRKGLDGLFVKLAEEEKRIRENPAARTTDLLKQVFGAAMR